MAAAAAMRGDLPAGHAAGEDGVHQGLRIPSFHRAAERVVHTQVLGPTGRPALSRILGVFLAAVLRWRLLAMALRGGL